MADPRPTQATGSRAGSGTPAEVRPGVDDAFWFELSTGWVKEAVTERDAQAGKIQKWIEWVWPIYTSGVAGTTFGLTLFRPEVEVEPPVAVLLCLPILLILLTYCLALWAQQPVPGDFDENIPVTIMACYNHEVRVKNRLLTATHLSMVLASLSVAVALFLALLGRPKPAANFRAIHGQGDSAVSIGVTGVFPEGSAVGITVKALPVEEEQEAVLVERGFIAASSGLLQVSIPVDTLIREFEVTAKWKEKDGSVRTLSRQVKSEQQGK